MGPLLGTYGARQVLLAIGAGQIIVALPFVWFAFRRHETLPEMVVALP